MKIIDKYLIKQFLQTIFFGILAFSLLFVIIDVMENLDDFIDQNVPYHVIFHYYMVFLPDMIKLMTPVAVLFGALFTVGKASNLSELTAIKASGISMYRFMAPFLISTLIISIFSIYFSGYVVPMANQTKLNIERNYLKRGFVAGTSNLFFQDTNTRIINIAYFDESKDQANRVSIQNFDKNDYTKMISRIDATNMRYDSTNHDWIAFKGIQRIFTNNGQNVVNFNRKEMKVLNFTPSELAKKQQKPEEMNLSELKDLIESQKRTGNDATQNMIEYYSRFSFPMASIIVVLFGLTISANKQRGTVAAQVGFNILATFIYLVFMKVSEAFGKNGAMDPLLTAWFANLFFLAAALVNLPRVRQ
ncbi:MAG TPA: LptF/LptG family permease [Ignavibacteriaceae bacterium]|nr:LptF/LptG family permease [Ignavibacteriaceae bacterium]